MINLWSNTPPKLRYPGPRVAIRTPNKDDKSEWLRIRRESRDFLEPWEPAWPEDALTTACFKRRLKRMSDDWEAGRHYAFFIERNEDEQLLGGITISNVRFGVVQSASLGYWIGHEFARNGYMSDAIKLAITFCFTRLNLHRIEAACLPNNDASMGLLVKNGFQKEGYARKYLCINNQWQDHVTFALLRSDLEF